MPNPDEIIDAGFAGLKTAQPALSAAQLTIKARRREKAAKMKNATVGLGACLIGAAIFATAMRPTSAMAALRESVRLSAAQPVTHLHIANRDFEANLTPTYSSALDIWKFQDHYIRKQGHLVCELFKSGRSLAYDDRFPFGFDTTYDAKSDHFWTFDGSIGVEVDRRRGLSPTEKSVKAHGGQFSVYEWRFTNSMQTRTAERIYVDPQSHLIRYAEGDRVEANGNTNHGLVEVDYPSVAVTDREGPHFPKGCQFRNKKELVGAFYRAMAEPEQTRSIRGIRSSLYGVIIHPGNNNEGLEVEIVTRGGAAPFTSGHWPIVVGGPLLVVKEKSFGGVHGHEQLIHSMKYIRNVSLDLLSRVPSRITVRVPVFGHTHEFVGYVTFTTSRIFCCLNDTDINWYDVAGYRM